MIAKRVVRVPELVGRAEERRLLDAAWSRALRFEAPQFVTVLGPIGIGKTRLVDTWLRALEEREDCRVLRVSARPASVGEPEPLGVIADLLRVRFGVDDRLAPEAAMQAFRGELQAVFGDRRVADVAGLLGTFLGLSAPESLLGQVLALRPEQESEVSRAVLCRFLEEDARRKPLVITVDDAHLADDASIDVIAHLAGQLGEAPLLVIVVARPELMVRRPEWGRGEGSHARVELRALSALEMDVFIRLALGSDRLAPGLAERAAIESGGNPFLLEQLLRVYEQHGILVAETGDNWWFDFDRASRERPDVSPAAAAQARVADLSPAERDVLVRAASFGMTFWTGGVIALGRLGAEPWDATTVFAPDPAIEETRRVLASLEERGYLQRGISSIIAGETEWTFSRAAERTLLVAALDPEVMRRRTRFAAQWLEGRAGPRVAIDELELIASLYEQGEDNRKAGYSFIQAGDEARRRVRYDRARALYLRGIGHLGQDDSVANLDAYHKLGDVAARLGRTREALAHFGEMLKVAWRMDLPGKGGAAHARIGRLHRALGDYNRALQHLDLARFLFELAADRPGIAATFDDMGRVHFLTGAPIESMRHHRAALAVREELGDERGKALTLSWMGLVEAQSGNLAQAQRHFQQALALARATRDPHGIVFSLLDLGALAREAGDVERAPSLLEEARRLARELGERICEAHLSLQIAECLLLAGRAPEAQAELEAARELAQPFGARRLVADIDRALAEARLAQGDLTGARDHAHRAVTAAESMGARPLTGAALRVLATAVARGAPGDPDRGGPREMFDRAVELLNEAGAELELGRTFAAYAEFEERTGRSVAALELRTQAQGIQQRARLGVTTHAAAGFVASAG